MTAILSTMRSGGAQHSAEIMNFLASALITIGGVVNANSNDFKTIQQTSPNMSVKIKQGKALIPASDFSLAYPVRLWSSDKDVTIGANATGNVRVDSICLYIDLNEGSPDTTISNVAKIAVVQGTVPNTAPTDGELATALSNNPFIRLSNISVSSGATSIVTANIADTRVNAQMTLNQPKIQGQGQDWVDLTDGASIVIDLSKGNKFKVTTTNNPTFTVINATKCQTFQVRIKQGAGGNHVPTFFTANWPDGVAPTASTEAGKIDKFIFDIVSLDPLEIDGDVIGLNH